MIWDSNSIHRGEFERVGFMKKLKMRLCEGIAGLVFLLMTAMLLTNSHSSFAEESAEGPQEVIACSKDTYVQSNYPHTDFSIGVSGYNVVLVNCADKCIGMLEFDLSSTDYSVSEFLEQAKLQIQVKYYLRTGDTTITAYEMPDDIWPGSNDIGSGLSYSNSDAENITEAISGSSVLVNGTGTYEMDVTDYVLEKYNNGIDKFSIALVVDKCQCSYIHQVTLKSRNEGSGSSLVLSYSSDVLLPVYDTLNDLREAGSELLLGDVVRTQGYYEANDGGGGKYDIVAAGSQTDNGGATVLVGNGLAAILKMESGVSVKQFGAYGDGIEDDTAAMKAALNAPTHEVLFPSGEYKATSRILISTGDKRIVGNADVRSIIFTDGSYNELSAYWKEWFLLIRADNIIFEGITFETRETSFIGNSKYNTQVAVMGFSENVRISNIAFNNCGFFVAPEVDGKIYNNLDLHAGWSNVSIANCEFYLNSEAESGTCIMARDLLNYTADRLEIIDNTFYKICHDEILWIYGNEAVISDIVVSGNYFEVEYGEIASPTVYAITVGSDFSIVENVLFEDNEVVVEASCAVLNLINVKDMLATNNGFSFTRVGNINAVVFTSAKGVNENVMISENKNITINSDISAICNAKNIEFTDNSVYVDGDVHSIFGRKCGGIWDNEIVVNGNVNMVSDNVYYFVDNDITITGTIGKVFQYFEASLSKAVLLSGNVVNILTDSDTTTEHILMANLSYFNEFPLIFINNSIHIGPYCDPTAYIYTLNATNNTIKATEATKSNYFYYIALRDTTSQNIYFSGNVFEGFWVRSTYGTIALPNILWANPLEE